MFHVICLETGELLKDDAGNVLTFATGQEAAAHATAVTETTGKRHQPRPARDDQWREREAQRFADGTYERLPWDIVPLNGPVHQNYRESYGRALGDALFRSHYRGDNTHWFYRGPGEDHFAHVSKKFPGNIAFTETEEKGARDIQTSMRPGRYLQRYYSHVLPPDDIRRLANEFLARYGDVELRFASTEDDIEHVYTHGPRSCMSQPANHYSSDVHPVRVYAAGDLAVAYLVAKEADDKITARVLCWPARKIYGRIYGDEQKLSAMLEDQGYTEGELTGARILKIPQGSAYIMPYIDGAHRVTDCGDHFEIDPHGEVAADRTDGLSAPPYTCDRCGDGVGEDDVYYIADVEEHWCDDCYMRYAFYCEYRCEFRTDGPIEVHVRKGRVETWSEAAVEEGAFQCDCTGEYWANEFAIEMANGETWSLAAFEDGGFACDECLERYPAYECVHAHGKKYCEACAPDEDGDDTEIDRNPAQTE